MPLAIYPMMIYRASVCNFNPVVAALISSAIVTMILFFMDEGYYDFRWMKSAGNWIAFIIYVAALFPVQWVLLKFLFRSDSAISKIFFGSIIGVVIALILICGVIFRGWEG